MKIKIIDKNYRGLGYDTMLISEGKRAVKYIGFTKAEAIKVFNRKFSY